MLPLVLIQQAGDSGQAPVLIGLFEARGGNTGVFETHTELLKLVLVANR